MQTANAHIKDKHILELQDVKLIRPNFDVLKIVNKEAAGKAQILLFERDRQTISVLTTNNEPNLISQILDKIAQKGFKFQYYYTDDESFEHAMKWYIDLDQLQTTAKQERVEKRDVTGKSAVEMIKKVYEQKDSYGETEFINELVRLSFQAGSSDLHFQSEEAGIVMRIRKDGVLRKVLVFAYSEFRKYQNKLKFMSGVRLNVDYIPQDGRFSFETNIGGEVKGIDVRVNFMPGIKGESIVLRFLDSTKGIMSFSGIGFMDENLDKLQKALQQKEGIIFVTGPTGSGKTTTLYSILNYLNDSSKKIITLEDPIEYVMPGVQQSQINEQKGYTYEDGLKAILRQDPDVIMIGEIRTVETAKIAINAALTGHLVLSTLHTNSAVESISRLLNMGVEPYMLAPAMNLIVSQRLIRNLDDCKSERDPSMAEMNEIKDQIRKINDANPRMRLKFKEGTKIPLETGCENCGGDGYSGRIAATETLEINDDIKDIIIKGGSGLDVYAQARQGGYLTMKEDAYIKMLKGMTTLDEIRRVM